MVWVRGETLKLANPAAMWVLGWLKKAQQKGRSVD
jgi:hypothetical protein